MLRGRRADPWEASLPTAFGTLPAKQRWCSAIGRSRGSEGGTVCIARRGHHPRRSWPGIDGVPTGDRTSGWGAAGCL